MSQVQGAVAGPDPVESADIAAPLYVAWQLTNECNLACLHCIEESGPKKAFPDELSREEVLGILEQMADAEVPYLALSGGEPMVHPHFFEFVEFVTSRGMSLKVETNGHFLTEEACRRMRELGVKAVQVSLDGTTPSSFERMRTLGRFEKAIEGIKNLVAAGVPLEINFSPARFNVKEIGPAIDLAARLGAYSFYTGRTMYTGNAVKTWRLLGPSEEEYREFFRTLHAKTAEYEGRMRVHFHEMGLLEELKYRLEHPAALFIILPNGLVKLVNALPFVCGDLRRQSLGEVWRNFQKAWKDPRVADFVHRLEKEPTLVSTLHQWVPLHG